MFKVFQSGQAGNLIIISIIFLVVWGLSLFSFGLVNLEPYPQMSLLPIDFDGLGWFTIILSPILVFLAFLHLNFKVNHNDLTKSHGFLVLFFGLLILAGLPWSYKINSTLIYLILLVFAVQKVLKLAYPNASHSDVFDLGFIVGLMGITYLPSLVLFIWVYQALLFLRNFSLREWLMPIIGAAIPFFYLWLHYFLMDWELPFFLLHDWFSFSFPQSLNLQDNLYVFTIGIGLVFLIAIGKYIQAIQSSKIRVRKSLNLVLWLMAYGILGFLFLKGSFLFLAIMLGVPGSIVLAIFFGTGQQTKLKTYVGWLFVIALLLNIIQGFI